MRGFSIIVLIFLLWGIIQPVYADTKTEIDSLEQIIKTTTHTNDKIGPAIRLTRLLWTVSANESAYYGNMAYVLSEKNGDLKSATRALLYLAVAKYYIGEYDSCIYFSNEAIKLSPKKRLEATKSFAFNLISISYKNLGDFDKALDYAEKSYTIRKMTTDTVNIAGSLDNMAHIYREMGNYEKAMQYALKALVLFQNLNDSLEMAKIYAGIAKLYLDMENTEKSLADFLIAKNLLSHYRYTLTYADVHFNIGSIFLKRERYDTALHYFMTSFNVYRKMGVQEGKAEAYQNIGLCYSGKNDFKKALEFLHLAHRFFINSGSGKEQADVEQSLGLVFIDDGKYDSAQYYLQNAYQLSRRIKYSNGIKSTLKTLASLYEKTGDPKALAFYKKYVFYRDSIEGLAVKVKLAELQTKYETSKKEKRILQLQIDEKTQKTKIQRLLFILALFVLLFFVFAVFVYFKRKNERDFFIQKNIIAQKDNRLANLELEQTRLKAKHFEEELNFKIKQLTTHSLNMMQKSNLLQDISHSLDEIMQADCVGQVKKLSLLKMKMAHHLKSENDWDLFKMYFEQINGDFISKLKTGNPNLTENEIRLSALIKIGMTLKETASVLNISPNSVKNARYRLKNRLNIGPEEDLNTFINNL